MSQLVSLVLIIEFKGTSIFGFFLILTKHNQLLIHAIYKYWVSVPQEASADGEK